MKFLISILFFLIALSGYCNNIVISNVSTIGQDFVNHFTNVQFDISWDNSWRTSSAPNNWDAAWIFVKYRIKNESVFRHATINTTNSNHTAPAGSTINTTSDGKGVFIFRSGDGSGTFSLTGVQLRWEYGTDGLQDADVVEVRVLGIEMVYVPSGSFWIGSGSATNYGEFYTYPTTTSSYNITSEGSITVGTTAGNLYYNNSSSMAGDRSGPIPAAFSKGFNAFYCMKYEISHAQMIDFFNMLQHAQADNVDYPSTSNGHNETGTHPAITSTCPTRAYNFMVWSAAAAYADWAALRPMTELEYEKACRGTATVTTSEYAWGTNTVYSTGAYTIANSGTATESLTNQGTSIGNALYSTTAGSNSNPLRCGIFAKSSTSKQEAGASYYGIMEMSGNLWEMCVSVGNATGRGFTGVHGDGYTAANGFAGGPTSAPATLSTWPGYVSGNLSITDNTGTNGIASRGGAFNSSSNYMRVSDRYYAANYLGAGDIAGGARLVRTAP